MITRNKLEQLVLDCLNELMLLSSAEKLLIINNEIKTYSWIEIVNIGEIYCNNDDFTRITERVLDENNLSYKQKLVFFNLMKMYTKIE